MKKTLITAMVAASCAAFAQAPAEEEAPVAPETAAAANADLAMKIDETVKCDDPETLLESKFEAFREKKREKDADWDWGRPDARGDVYLMSDWAVELDSTQPEFIKARWFAFEKAYTRALAQYTIDTYGKLVGRTISEEFGDDSTDARELAAKPSATLEKKIELLAEAKVDKALAEEGVPESQYKGKDLVAKRVIFADTIKKTLVKKAIHDSSGCIPIQTFEAFNDKSYRVGVIIKGGPQCKSLAKCFRMKKRPMLVKEGAPWASLKPSDEAMLQEFGARLFFDETGTPSLVSYGQFGTSYTGKNAAMRERFERQAKHQAVALADSKISEFMKSMMAATDETPELSMQMENAVDSFSDDTVSEEDRIAMVDQFRRNYKMDTDMDMAGITTVYGPKIIKHPSGHRVAVVVRRWSFAQVDAIKEMERIERETERAGAVPPPPKAQGPKGGSGVNSGKVYDF